MLQIIIIVLALAADQLSKFLLVPVLSSLPGKTLPVIEGVFHLTYIQNKGASFGILQGKQLFFIIVTVIVLIAATVYIIRGRKTHSRFLKITLALLWAGAFGNLIDRVLFGYVRDLFDFRIINFWVFNVADSCLVIGAVLLCVYLLFICKDKPCAKTDVNKDDDDSSGAITDDKSD